MIMNHCGECYYWELTSNIKEPSPSRKCTLDDSWGIHAGQMACRQFRKDKKKKRHTMNEGIPDCPDCGGKGMCDKHKLEYLQYEYEKAENAYEDELFKQKQERKNK